MLSLPETVGSPYTDQMRTLLRSVQSQIYVTLMNTSYADNGRAMLYNVSFLGLLQTSRRHSDSPTDVRARARPAGLHDLAHVAHGAW